MQVLTASQKRNDFPHTCHYQRESGLGKEEYRAVGNAVVDLTDPNRSEEPVRRKRGKYTTYTEQTKRKYGNMLRRTVTSSPVESLLKPFQPEGKQCSQLQEVVSAEARC